MSSAPRGLAPREGLGSVLMKMGHAGPPFEPHCRQASLGAPIPKTPTVAPGPKARPDLAMQGGGRARAKRRGPSQPAALGAAWRLIGCGRHCSPMPSLFCAMLGGPVVVHSRSPFWLLERPLSFLRSNSGFCS